MPVTLLVNTLYFLLGYFLSQPKMYQRLHTYASQMRLFFECGKQVQFDGNRNRYIKFNVGRVGVIVISKIVLVPEFTRFSSESVFEIELLFAAIGFALLASLSSMISGQT